MDQRSPRILLIEDDADAAALMAEALADHFGQGLVHHAATVAEALAVDPEEFDLALSDMNLPDGNGLELLDRLLDARPDLPVVFVTGEGILENAIKAIRRGAYDYVVKAGDYLFSLPVVVEKNLALYAVKQDNLRLQAQLAATLAQVRVKNQQLEEAVSQLELMAATDPLTGLANRRSFGQALQQCFDGSAECGRDVSLVMIDLDGFKQLNDALGHQRGDDLLRRAAEALRTHCRKTDLASRFGGDEFIIMLPDTDEATAIHVAERIRGEFEQAAREALAGEKTAGRLTMSLGLATLQKSQPESPEQFIAMADHALYAAKAAGKTCLMVHRPARPPQRAGNAACGGHGEADRVLAHGPALRVA